MSPLLLFEGGIEGLLRGREIKPFHECRGLWCSLGTLHAAIFPLHGEWPLIADTVEGADNLLELDAVASRGAEIPAAARIAEVQVRAKNAGAPIKVACRVLDMYIVDAVGKGFKKQYGINKLVMQMTGVEVNAKGGPMLDGL